MSAPACRYCDDPIDHPEDHPDMCCDCFDVSCGMPLEAMNRERAGNGLGPLPVKVVELTFDLRSVQGPGGDAFWEATSIVGAGDLEAGQDFFGAGEPEPLTFIADSQHEAVTLLAKYIETLYPRETIVRLVTSAEK